MTGTGRSAAAAPRRWTPGGAWMPAGLAACLLASPAQAQIDANQDLVVQLQPFEYDRERNTSVTERARPDYDPLGIRAGAFLIYPRLALTAGYSNNVFLTEGDATGDGYARIAPSIAAVSDWSRHALYASAGGNFRRFLDAARANESNYNMRARGRLDVSRTTTLTVEGQAARLHETPFSGELEAVDLGISSYDYNGVGVRAQTQVGRGRLTGSIARAEYDFRPLRFAAGATLDQAERNRVIQSAAVRGEYALSTSLALFGQLTVADTAYDHALSSGLPNRDSLGYRFLGGVNMDLSALLRGSIGLGYAIRDFDDARYDDVRGFSAEATLEYFRSELTTFTLRARRVLQDSNIATVSAYFDNGVSLRADHEMMRNMLLNGSVEYARQDYIGSERSNDIYRIRGGMRYLASPFMSLAFDMSYADRSRRGAGTNGSLDELRAELSITIHP